MFATRGERISAAWRFVCAHPVWASLALSALAAAFCLACDMRDGAVIRAATRAAVSLQQPGDQQVRALTSWIYSTTKSSRNTRYFILPGMRASARQVLEDGGDCADKARLEVAMLASLGMPATPVMLFDPISGEPVHTVVEAEYSPGRRMVVDPSFNLVFPRAGGGYHDVVSLRADPGAAIRRMDALRTTQPWPGKVFFYQTDSAGYERASTFHWRSNLFSRLIFAVLHPFLAGRVYQVRRPEVLENPARACAVMAILLGLALSVFIRLCRGRSTLHAPHTRRHIRLFLPECRTGEDASVSRTRWACIMIAGLGLRLAWMAWAQPSPVSDFLHHQLLAEQLFDHHQFGWPEPTAYRLPVFPALLSVLIPLSRHTALPALACVALSTALIAVVHRLALMLTNGKQGAALAAGGLWALNPAAVYFSPVLAPEHLFCVLVGCSLILVLRNPPVRAKAAAAAGLLMGLAALTQKEGLFYAPVLLVACGARAAKWRVGLARAASFGAAMMLVIAPWVVRNHSVLGTDVQLCSASGVQMYLAHNPEAYGHRELEATALHGLEERAANALGAELAYAYALEHPGHLVRHAARGMAELLKPSNYALFWSTGWSPKDASTAAPLVKTGILYLLSALSAAYFAGLLVLGTAGQWRLRNAHVAGGRILLGLGMMHLVCNTVCFWGAGRGRYPLEAGLCICGGIAVHAFFRNFVHRDARRIERVGLLSPA